jgi:hypothetical protein
VRIELLQGSLAVAENPGMDSTDPRFDDISTLVQAGDYAAAAKASEAVLAEQIYDIRLICYFVYGHWVEQGPVSLGEVFSALSNALFENWEAIGPVAKREKKVELSLNWLFKQTLKALQYEETKQSSAWKGWIDTLNSDDIQPALESLEAFRRGLSRQMEDAAGSVLDITGKLQEWLRNFQRLVYKPEPEPEPEPEAAPEPGAASAAPTVGGIQGQQVEGSFHLSLLLQKLEAFERLIEQEKFSLAALVADDINATLGNFDPKLFFPKLFRRFALLQVMNIGRLSPYGQFRETIEWQAMQELLKVDIDAFASYDGEFNPGESGGGGSGGGESEGYSGYNQGSAYD